MRVSADRWTRKRQGEQKEGRDRCVYVSRNCLGNRRDHNENKGQLVPLREQLYRPASFQRE